MTAEGAFTAADHAAMAEALRLARRGLYTTDPNPRVGCVLARDGEVVGRGWHERAGGPHAEVAALRDAGECAAGATAYVTLEPCNHHGRTPPCVDALIEAGVSRVVSAMADPNPQVAGRGLARLREAGLSVTSGLMAEQAEALNPGFISRMRRGRPWIRLKLAASLDGHTALPSGESRWITGAAARADGHRFRARASAILTASGTVLADDPRLTVRLEGEAVARQPLRVVLDRTLVTPPSAALLQAPGDVLFLVGEGVDSARRATLEARGARVMPVPLADDKLDLSACLTRLAAEPVNELHVEAGATLAGSLLEAGLVDELTLYTAPRILGAGRGLFALPALGGMGEAQGWQIQDWRRIGHDFRIIARPEYHGTTG